MNKREYFDIEGFRKAKAKLPLPDGIHCVICGKKLSGRRRKYCTDECYEQWYVKNIKKDFNLLRRMVKKRDDYKCKECGVSDYDINTELEVHHIIPIKDGGEEFNINNCITLCKKCHKKKHQKVKQVKKPVNIIDKKYYR